MTARHDVVMSNGGRFGRGARRHACAPICPLVHPPVWPPIRLATVARLRTPTCISAGLPMRGPAQLSACRNVIVPAPFHANAVARGRVGRPASGTALVLPPPCFRMSSDGPAGVWTRPILGARNCGHADVPLTRHVKITARGGCDVPDGGALGAPICPAFGVPSGPLVGCRTRSLSDVQAFGRVKFFA